MSVGHFPNVNNLDNFNSTGLSKAQATALKTAWKLFKVKLSDHARNIFAQFYEENPESLQKFHDLGNVILHKHTEDVLNSLSTLIDDLEDPESFNSKLSRVKTPHQNVSRNDVSKLNKIIKIQLLEELAKHKTKTLEDALDVFLMQIEAKFEDPSDVNKEES